MCSFQFADLRRQGFLSLVAGLGIADRPSCGGIVIIDATKQGFEFYGSGGETGAGGDVSAQIRDLHHDGHLEFVLDATLGVLPPQQCAASWTAIYAWTDDNYTNVSSQFKDFYAQKLDSLRKIIPALQAVPGPNGFQLRDKECLEAEASAIERYLGVSPDSGLDQAIRLAGSKSPDDRQFATELLGAIGSPKARDYLEKLSQDPNPEVMVFAKYCLERTGKGPSKLVADAFKHGATYKR
jgi:hypothetical protein